MIKKTGLKFRIKNKTYIEFEAFENDLDDSMNIAVLSNIVDEYNGFIQKAFPIVGERHVAGAFEDMVYYFTIPKKLADEFEQTNKIKFKENEQQTKT